MNTTPLSEGDRPACDSMKRKSIDVVGRKEHEAWLKDPKKCAEYGLDLHYETMIYLKRWGGWLKDEERCH